MSLNPIHPHCGPFNTVSKKRPRNRIDRACWKHDKEYGKIQDESGRWWYPYWYFNDADIEFIRDADGSPYVWFFKGKKYLMPKYKKPKKDHYEMVRYRKDRKDVYAKNVSVMNKPLPVKSHGNSYIREGQRSIGSPQDVEWDDNFQDPAGDEQKYYDYAPAIIPLPFRNRIRQSTGDRRGAWYVNGKKRKNKWFWVIRSSKRKYNKSFWNYHCVNGTE